MNKDNLIYFVMYLIIFYCVISLMSFVVGFVTPNNSKNDETSCLTKPRNIEMFLPAYKFGCWLSTPQGEQYYYEDKE